MHKSNRRDFLKFLAGSIGGVMLTTTFGCNGSGSSGYTALPNGYRFYRIKSTGQAAGNGADSLLIDYFYGTAHISNNNILTFDARNIENRGGIFQLGVDFSGSKPRIEWERTALLTDQTLPDDRIVGQFHAMDVNDQGNIAVNIVAGNKASGGQPPAHYGHGLYLDYEQGGFAPLVLAGTELHGRQRFCSGILGDVDLHENNEILAVVHHAPNGEGSTPGQGLFHLPAASVVSSNMVLNTGDYLNNTDHSLSHIGLIDRHDSGYFVA
ncbi:MAG: hypothetical protein ACQERN_02385, partial [Thermodesulfobacteriota bacterium]